MAAYLGVSETMVRGIDKTYLQRKFGRPKIGRLKYLAIDEFSVQKGHKYLTIVVDLVSGAAVFVDEAFWKRLRSSRAKINAVAT